MLIRALIATVLAITLAAPAAARDMTAAEKKGLKTTIDRYLVAVKKKPQQGAAAELQRTISCVSNPQVGIKLYET